MEKERFVSLLEENKLAVYPARTNKVPDDFFRTYSAFLNTDGGTILLGARLDEDDNLTITGVEDTQKLLDEIRFVIFDPFVCNVPYRHYDGYIYADEIDGKPVVVAEVPRVDPQYRPVEIILYKEGNQHVAFVRRQDGNYRCSEVESAKMASLDLGMDETLDMNKFKTEDLNSACIDRYRAKFRKVHESHPWNALNNEAFLLKIDALRYRNSENRITPSMHGMVMFGQSWAIKYLVPECHCLYEEKDKNGNVLDSVDTNSDSWTGNLFDFYEACCGRFDLAMERTELDPTDKETVLSALHELLVNAIVHTSYYDDDPIRITVTPDAITFKTKGILLMGKDEVEAGGVSRPRNTGIYSFFRHIRATHAEGCSIRNIEKAFPGRLNIEETYLPDTVTVTFRLR